MLSSAQGEDDGEAKPGWRRVLDRVRATPGRSRAVFGVAYGLAAAITALSVWLVTAAPQTGPIAPASRAVLLVLALNLLLILALAAAVAWRVLRLARKRETDAGSRLHLRFVTLFAMAAVAPAVIVAFFFGLLVTRGVESWFSQNVRTAVENGAFIARSYLQQQVTELDGELPVITTELGQVRNLFPDRIAFSTALESLAQARRFPAIYVIDAQGRVLARAEAGHAPPYAAPTPVTIAAAESGDAPARLFEGPDQVRAVTKLDGYPDAYLYVVRFLEPGIIGRLRNSEQSIVAYREREASRARVQAAFLLSYMETALLVLVGAVWLGMSAATSIAAPVARLVQAADRVAGGDLSARVEADRDPEEIAVLSRAFNRMTGDLQEQQEALRTASQEAQARSDFIETVLSGVSAGVMGLGPDGRISALNDQAATLLSLQGDDVVGSKAAEVAPELAHVIAAVGDTFAEEEIDIVRDADTRRLRVRASLSEGGGMVLTFDDITRLVTAQRNAAWRDVARRIAHEIKNPLTPIQLSAERLRRKYRSQIEGDVETFDRCTDTIIRQVGDIGRMVDEFSSFARMPAPKFAEEDAAELLRQAVFAQRVAQPDIPLELVEPDPRVPFVADGRMVGQALTNVLKNAGEAVAARRSVEGEGGGMRARLVVEEAVLTFEVEDDGFGLPAKDRDRLAEPYVTTREKGTGLGLAIVKRICEDHGGELVLADAIDLAGARVALRFPIIRTAAGAQPPAQVA